ncbi:hypothetical protein BC833DRAFT_626110 [Globomyces pollinis-pini]|nr:hypothetical protein BC833DRAFT_626110 [Globomyces pollinis-pini]
MSDRASSRPLTTNESPLNESNSIDPNQLTDRNSSSDSSNENSSTNDKIADNNDVIEINTPTPRRMTSITLSSQTKRKRKELDIMEFEKTRLELLTSKHQLQMELNKSQIEERIERQKLEERKINLQEKQIELEISKQRLAFKKDLLMHRHELRKNGVPEDEINLMFPLE